MIHEPHTPRRNSSETTRLYSKIRYTAADPRCWEFTGYLDRDGYGRFFSQGRTKLAHRVAYELAYGPIQAGLTVDHTCNTEPVSATSI